MRNGECGKGNSEWGIRNGEGGMGKAEKELVECLILIY